MICFSPDDEAVVLSRLASIRSQVSQTPDFRVAAGPYAESVLERLVADGIEFRSEDAPDKVHIILADDKDSDRVWALIQEESDAFIREFATPQQE